MEICIFSNRWLSCWDMSQISWLIKELTDFLLCTFSTQFFRVSFWFGFTFTSGQKKKSLRFLRTHRFPDILYRGGVSSSLYNDWGKLCLFLYFNAVEDKVEKKYSSGKKKKKTFGPMGEGDYRMLEKSVSFWGKLLNIQRTLYESIFFSKQ